MAVARYLLALDQGTSSSRAIAFTFDGTVVGLGQRPLPSQFPRPGWVEQDPETIWQTQRQAVDDVLASSGIQPAQIAAIGISNQRETTLLWERASGRPLTPAVVWQDRRTADRCRALRQAGAEDWVRERTGLLLDPYFSATKLAWLLEQAPALKEAATAGRVAFGTVDSWLLYRLTGGRVHATDPSNASRTLLFHLTRHNWDPELLRLFDVPEAVLPAVLPSAGLFGHTDPQLWGCSIPVTGVLGDQQAALFGQGCLDPGLAKNTYGTGAFLLLNVGVTPTIPRTGGLATVAWQIGERVTYALEGAMFVAGAVVQWLRDNLGLIDTVADSETLAMAVDDTAGVYFVPAFVGLGAPHWDPYARGTIVGLTQAAGRAHLVRAALEAMAYQTRDVLAAMAQESAVVPRLLRVDGGAIRNRFLAQFQADILGIPVERPRLTELSAWGAARMAALGADIPLTAAAQPPPEAVFTPAMSPARREVLWAGWRRAVDRARGWAEPAP